MVVLMNSAMMPNPGVYRMTRLSADEFARMIRANSNLESAIGYPATAAHIERLTGYRPKINRGRVQMSPGDTAIVCRLRYRVADPETKTTTTPEDNDFEYFLVTKEQ